MCIIIAKNKNDRLPTRQELINCFNNNNDGAGFMYTDNNQVVIDKGYMTETTFLQHYDKLRKQYNDFKGKSLVIHCRIGTGGTNTAKNTHPYPISDNLKELHAKRTTTTLGIAHNGVISDYNKLDDENDTNDTQNFIRYYLHPLYNNYEYFYENSYMLKGIQKITNSKFAILDANDNLTLIGDYVNDNNLSFSNNTYKVQYHYLYNYFKDDYYTNYNNYYTSYQKTKKTTPKEEDNGDYIQLPSKYMIELDNKIIIANYNQYFYNTKDKWLYKKHNGKLEKHASDFIIYNQQKEVINYD